MIYLVYLSFVAALLKLLGVINISWSLVLIPSAIAFAWMVIVGFIVFALIAWATK